MKTTMMLFVLALGAVACAPRPDAIAPVMMPAAVYSSMDCRNVATSYTNARQELTALERAQGNAATGDAIGVFLLAVPVSSVFGGDKSGLVGVKKGEVLALNQRLTQCQSMPATPAPMAG